MSGQCTGWVLRHGPKDRTMRAVLVTIADAANRDGEHAHPGMDAMVEGSLYSRATVFRTIKRLQDEGWIEVEQEGGGRGRATVFRVPMKGSHGETVSPEKRSQLPPETVSPGEETVSPETETVSRQVPDQQVSSPNGTNGFNGSTQHPSLVATDAPSRLCALLADLVERNGSKRPNITERWLVEADRLMRIDGRTEEQVEKAIRWSQTDDFWRGNVMSMPALREKYDRLRLAAQRNGSSRPTTVERSWQNIMDGPTEGIR